MNGHLGAKTIRDRISQLRKWHVYCRVAWAINLDEISLAVNAAKKLQPHPKLKREPFLAHHLAAIHPFVDFSNSFEVCFWAATCFGHRSLLRSGEFTLPSAGAFDPLRHFWVGSFSRTSCGGISKGFIAHLPFDKVNGYRGADIPLSPLANGNPTCQIAALAKHLDVNNPKPHEFLFTYVSAKGKSAGERRGMTKDLWKKTMNDFLAKAKLAPLDGHSIRIGGATQMLLDEVDPLVVKATGRWRSDVFLVYWRHISAILAQWNYQSPSLDLPSMSRAKDVLNDFRKVCSPLF